MITWFEKNRIVSSAITLLTAVEIFYFSTLQGTTYGGKTSSLIPIIYHFIVFFLFSFFFLATIKGSKKIKPKYMLITLFVSLVYAVLDEIHQLFVPYRDASLKDIFIDALGISASMITYLCINKKLR